MINADGSSYVLSGYYEIINDFGIDLVNEFINKEDNPIKFLKTSFNEYLLNGSSIKKYDVTEREMFMLTSDACVSNRKKESSTTIKVLSQNSHKNYWVQKQLKDWKDSQSTPPTQEEIDQKTQEFEQSYNPQTARVNYKSSRTLSLTYNDGGNVVVSGKTGSVYYQIGTNNNPDEIVYLNYDNLTDFLNTHTNVNPKFSITESNKSFDITITLDYNVNEIKVIVKNGSRTTFSATYQIDVSQYFSRTLYVNFFNEYSVIKTYCYLQNVTKEEYDQHSALYGDWVNTSCPLPNWTEYTSFQKECDEKWDFDCDSTSASQCTSTTPHDNEICYKPKDCLPSDRYYLSSSAADEIIKAKVQIVSDMKTNVQNIANDSPDTNNDNIPDTINSFKDRLVVVKEKYYHFIDSYTTVLDIYIGKIREITSELNRYSGVGGETFGFINCKFIGKNVKVILNYLKDALGKDLYTVGVCLVLSGCSIALSIISTILLIIIINTDIAQKKTKPDDIPVIPFVPK